MADKEGEGAGVTLGGGGVAGLALRPLHGLTAGAGPTPLSAVRPIGGWRRNGPARGAG